MNPLRRASEGACALATHVELGRLSVSAYQWLVSFQIASTSKPDSDKRPRDHSPAPVVLGAQELNAALADCPNFGGFR